MKISVSEHPRASASIRRFKAACGLAGFLIGAYVSHKGGLPAFDVVLRALIAGIVLRTTGWVLAVGYWRAAILAELEQAHLHRREKREAADQLLRDTAAAGSQHA